MDYVRNAWYVAGWSREINKELKRVTILETDLVMFRSDSNGVVALLDRCPHKLLPLSMGRRIGDNIQCGYHGLTFNFAGECVRVPGQDNVPSLASVRKFPVLERNDIIWVWMGDRALADTSKIIDLPALGASGWAAHQGDALHLKANYLNVAENLCDPAHVSFVHPTTLGNSASEDVPIESRRLEDGTILTWRWVRNGPPVGFFQKFGGFSGNVDRWHYYYLHLPSTAVIDFGSGDSVDQLDETGRDRGVRIFALHFLTPVNEHYTIDRWMHVRNTALDDPNVANEMDELFRVAFSEDKEILEAIDAEERRVRDHRPIRLAIDKGANLYRREIERLLSAERANM
ncbi:MAG: Rieske 2Fe-2S domain-containing protein [Hyphomicrobiaceae bacterium]